MGAGCYYTHNNSEIENRRAFWIDMNYTSEDEDGNEIHDEFIWDDTIGNLKYTFKEIGYNNVSEYIFENGLFQIELESGYGGEIIVRLEPKGEERYYAEDNSIHNLALSNHDRSYDKIKRALLAEGYELRIATSGYTSTSISE